MQNGDISAATPPCVLVVFERNVAKLPEDDLAVKAGRLARRDVEMWIDRYEISHEWQVVLYDWQTRFPWNVDIVTLLGKEAVPLIRARLDVEHVSYNGCYAVTDFYLRTVSVRREVLHVIHGDSDGLTVYGPKAMRVTDPRGVHL